MKKSTILFDETVEHEITAVLDEIISYIEEQIEEQSQSGTLNSEFYTDILLFLSEMFPHLEDQEKWLDLGYMICREIKQNLEKYGYQKRSGMFAGLGFQCFAVNQFCKQANILKDFSHSLNALLFLATENRIKQIKNDETYDYNYDLISGISGILYYLLDCDYTEDEKDVLIKCIEYLLEFTKDIEFCGQTVIKFHILQSNQNKNFDQEDYKSGSINFGLAHGMLGPLIALSKAYAKGFIMDGLRDGIEKIYQVYETFKSVNEEKVPHWPKAITVEEYSEGICKSKHIQVMSSWCYGNVGIIRGLQKVSDYMNWKEIKQSYTEVLKHFYTLELKDYNLLSPSLCHGFSSLVAIQTCAYSACGDPELLCHLERNVRKIIWAYRQSNAHEVKLVDILSKTNRVEGYLEDLSLLTGSTGVAITLLSLKGKIATGNLLMID